MKTFFRLLSLSIPLLVWAPGAFAQTATQQTNTRLDAGAVCQNSQTSAGSFTFTPPTGQSFYLTSLDIEDCSASTAAVATTPTSVTISNMGGGATTLKFLVGSGNASGQCVTAPVLVPPEPIKSTTSQSVVVTLPTFATGQTLSVNVCGYYAP